MILKVHSPERATYRQYLLARILLSGLGAIILFVGGLNIYFAASPGGLPFLGDWFDHGAGVACDVCRLSSEAGSANPKSCA